MIALCLMIMSILVPVVCLGASKKTAPDEQLLDLKDALLMEFITEKKRIEDDNKKTPHRARNLASIFRKEKK